MEILHDVQIVSFYRFLSHKFVLDYLFAYAKGSRTICR